MFTRQEISVGKCYVNEKAKVAREVVEEVNRHKIKYNAFDLTTGRLLPPAFQVCFKSQIAYWADREAKPTEFARLHPYNHDDNSGFEELPTDDEKMAELELVKAKILQMAAPKTINR